MVLVNVAFETFVFETFFEHKFFLGLVALKLVVLKMIVFEMNCFEKFDEKFDEMSAEFVEFAEFVEKRLLPDGDLAIDDYIMALTFLEKSHEYIPQEHKDGFGPAYFSHHTTRKEFAQYVQQEFNAQRRSDIYKILEVGAADESKVIDFISNSCLDAQFADAIMKGYGLKNHIKYSMDTNGTAESFGL